jgi:hypothetical protein
MEDIEHENNSSGHATTYFSGHATKNKCSKDQDQINTESIVLAELTNLNEKIQKIEEKIDDRSKIIEEKISEIIKQQVSQIYDNTVLKIEEALGKFYSSTLNNIQLHIRDRLTSFFIYH